LPNQVICFKDEFDLNILAEIHLKQHQQTYTLSNGHTKMISNSNVEHPPQNVQCTIFQITKSTKLFLKIKTKNVPI
jgi:hypothetical protein